MDDLIKRAKAFKAIQLSHSIKSISKNNIAKCVNDKTLPRFSSGTKLILTSDSKPVLLKIDNLESGEPFAYDFNNNRLFKIGVKDAPFFLKD